MSGYFRIELTDAAIRMLRRIGKKYGKDTYETLRDLIKELEFNPDQKGQALRKPLHGLFSLHYSRFRVLYSIDNNELRVIIVAAGHHASGSRNDIYDLVKRLIENGDIVLREKE